MITRVKNTIEQEEEIKRREHAKLDAKKQLELIEEQRKERQRRQEENRQREEESKETDYKSILRDARRAERRELNKALEENEKLRQLRLTEELTQQKQLFSGISEDREAIWNLEDEIRREKRLERERWREDTKNLDQNYFEEEKKRDKQFNEELETHQKQTSQWNLVYETTSEPRNQQLPQAVLHQTLANVLQDIDEYGSDEDYDLREAQRRRRVENQAGPRDKEIDIQINDAKRSVAEKALMRARQQRRTRTIY